MPNATTPVNPDTLHTLEPIQSVEEMTDAQIDELQALETHLTLYQVDLLMKAATSPYWQRPLWGHPVKEAWAQSQTLSFYYAPSILEELELREFLQCKELERMQLITLNEKALKQDVWTLTPRGHLLVLWHLRTVADYQALLTPEGLMHLPSTTPNG
jgi:hypothetical protein